MSHPFVFQGKGRLEKLKALFFSPPVNHEIHMPELDRDTERKQPDDLPSLISRETVHSSLPGMSRP